MARRIVHRRIVRPDAPALGPVLTISPSELRVMLDRRATGPTRIASYELDRSNNGTTWVRVATGLGIWGSDNDYEDAGLQPVTTYTYRCRAVDTTSRRSEYSYSSGTTGSGVVNQPPAWQAFSLSIAAGNAESVVARASDPEGVQLAFSRVGGTAPSGVTCSVAGIVAVDAGVSLGDYTLTLRASDGSLTADVTVSLTVTAAGQAATYVIPASSSSRTLNGGSASGWASFGPNRAPAAGDVIEFAAGTHGTLTFSNLVGGAGNPIVVRPASGALVILSSTSTGFRWNINNCQHLTINGATTNAAASIPISGAPSRCGFKMNGAGNCTAWIKFGITTRLPKSVTIQYVEIAGSNTTGTCVMYHDNSGNRMANFPNQWSEDLVLRYNYFHNAGGLYIGSNYECDETGGLEAPCRRTTVEYNRVVNATEECLGLKMHWEGPNYVRHNWFEASGRDSVGSSIDQRNAVSIQCSTVVLHDNVIVNSGQGNTAQGAGMGPSGVVIVANNGPDVTGVPSAGSGVPGSAYSSYGPFPYFDIEIFNNIIVDNAWHGIQSSLGTTNGNKGPGVVNLVPQKLKVYSNTICTSQLAGVRIAAASAVVSGSFIRNNILLGNASGALAGYASNIAGDNLTSGDTVASLFVAPASAYASRNYHLTRSVPVGAGSVLGTDVATTDMDGDTRVLASADMGAYEYG